MLSYMSIYPRGMLTEGGESWTPLSGWYQGVPQWGWAVPYLVYTTVACATEQGTVWGDLKSWQSIQFQYFRIHGLVWYRMCKTNERGFASNWVLWKQTSAYSTGQASGIAALHACFMSGNPPYCTQIPQEKHAWNTRVKKYMQKYTRKYM